MFGNCVCYPCGPLPLGVQAPNVSVCVLTPKQITCLPYTHIATLSHTHTHITTLPHTCTQTTPLHPHRVIKWSSPLLNMLIILGAAIFYVDVILFGVDIGTPASESTVNVLCMVNMCLMCQCAMYGEYVSNVIHYIQRAWMLSHSYKSVSCPYVS